MVSNQHEYMDPDVDQRIEEIELKSDQQLALIEALMIRGKRRELQMKEFIPAALMDSFSTCRKYIL